MKKFNRSLAVLSVTFGLALGSAVPLAAAGYQDHRYRDDYGYRDDHRYRDDYRGRDRGDIRGIIDRTQSDLRASSEMEHNNDKQRKRYENAQINLSHLDRSVSRGRFDKDALKKSIDDLRDILKNNTLQASARDALQRDLEDLQIMRERH